MVSLKRLIGLLVILVMGFGCAAPVTAPETETRVVQEEPQGLLTIQGRVIDGNTLQVLQDVAVEITIKHRVKRRWEEVLKETQTTDEQGRYVFEDMSGDFLNQELYYVYFILKHENYLTTRYSYLVSKDNRVSDINLDFGLIKPSDKLILKGQVTDILDQSPLADVDVNVTFRIWQDRSKSIEPIKCRTDGEGYYEAELDTQYTPYALKRDRNFRIEFGKDVYEMVNSEGYCGREGKEPDQNPENMINFTQWIQNFALVEVKREGTLKGSLVDADGQPMTEVPLTIQFGQQQG